MTPDFVGSALQICLVMALAPGLQGWIKRVKAAWQSRQGPPLLQSYADLWKLLHKETLLPSSTSWIFRATPWLVLGCMLTAAALVPLVSMQSPLRLGDVITLIGLLALARFAQALASIDTGSAFAGMGASREMAIAALVEPALLVTIFGLAVPIGSTNADAIAAAGLASGFGAVGPARMLALAALLVVAIAETGRLPVDNPDTHLELTMVHEGMLLEYSGRPLAALTLAAFIKQTVVLGLVAALLLPWGLDAPLPLALVVLALKLAGLGTLLACIESVTAKLRILRLPELMATAFALGTLSLVAHGVFGA